MHWKTSLTLVTCCMVCPSFPSANLSPGLASLWFLTRTHGGPSVKLHIPRSFLQEKESDADNVLCNFEEKTLFLQIFNKILTNGQTQSAKLFLVNILNNYIT